MNINKNRETFTKSILCFSAFDKTLSWIYDVSEICNYIFERRIKNEIHY